jgi:cell wall-associated NlpC family hydrolase
VRKKAVAKWIFAATFVTVVLAVAVPAGATTIADYQKQQQELRRQQEELKKKQQAEQKQLNQLQGNIGAIEEDAAEIAGAITAIDESLVVIIASVEMITQEILEKEERILVTIAQLEEAVSAEEGQYEAMKMRIKYIYETADTTYLQVLVEAGSLNDMLNRLEYMEQLNGYDQLQLDMYRAARDDTLALKEQLEEERAALLAQEHELEEEKAEMERMLAEKREIYEDYELMLVQARQQAAVYSANIKAKSDQIKKLQQDEAAVKAKEVAAVKAAEEAKRKANAGNTSSAGKNYAAPNSFTGSTGQRIASYAVQFVGNPYVAGGTSLTAGADCSGFIWRVYNDFGYRVARSSWDFRSAGTGVEYADAKPGDVVCYAGHVGLYIGNGYIVHASTERTGITITPATYKTILAVRRLV